MSVVVAFTEEIETNRIAYSERFRLAVTVAKDWQTIEADEVKRFYDALLDFQSGKDTMISAYQALANARKIVRDLQKELKWPPEKIRTASAEAHLLLSQGLWAQGIANFVTVGNVRIAGVDVWKPTLGSLKSELMADYDPAAPFEAHAWISFPDMSIIDATWWFYEHRVGLPKKFSWPDRIIAGEPVRATIGYEPMVVGTKFLANGLGAQPWTA